MVVKLEPLADRLIVKPVELGFIWQFGYWVTVDIAAENELILPGIILDISVSDNDAGYICASCELDHIRSFDVDNSLDWYWRQF